MNRSKIVPALRGGILGLLIGALMLACTIQRVTTDPHDGGSDSDSSSASGSGDIQFVSIPKGIFKFGSPEGTPCRAAYVENQATVTLTRGFDIAATEVTQRQWTALGLPMPTQQVNVPDAPVVLVNFYEVAFWLNEWSKKDGLSPCYDLASCSGTFGAGCEVDAAMGCGCAAQWDGGCQATPQIYFCEEDIHLFADRSACPGYRLPTTAEWEYAARAGTTTHTYNGDLQEYDPKDVESGDENALAAQKHNYDVLNPIAWYNDNADNTIQPVGRKMVSPWGLMDVLGNALEWVDYYNIGRPLDESDGHPGELLIDPVGAVSGEQLDLRGQSFRGRDCRVRSARQFVGYPHERRNDTGFRPVRTRL